MSGKCNHFNNAKSNCYYFCVLLWDLVHLYTNDTISKRDNEVNLESVLVLDKLLLIGVHLHLVLFNYGVIMS